MKLGSIFISAAVVAVCVVIGLGYLYFTRHSRDVQRFDTVDAAGKSQASATAAGHDAVQAVQTQNQAEQATADLTRKNTDAIEHAKGAEAPVSPDLYSASLRALCLRHVFANDPRCRNLRHAGS